MDTSFLLLFAAVTALLTYAVVPRFPVALLVSAASVALAAGVWWHWAQFSTEYRLSTWQEQLRNYAGYALLFVVILLSYGFYALAVPASAKNAGISASVNAVTDSIGDVATMASNLVSDVFGTEEGEDEEDEEDEGENEGEGEEGEEVVEPPRAPNRAPNRANGPNRNKRNAFARPNLLADTFNAVRNTFQL